MKKNLCSSWDKYGSSVDLDRLNSMLIDFLTKNKTEREVVRTTVAYLKNNGAQCVNECETVKPGDTVYLNWKNRAIAVARIGAQPVSSGINAIISHGDAPRIDIKERPMYEKSNLAFWDSHYYGGIKKYQWVNVKMAIHGELHDGNGNIKPIVLGEDLTDPVFTIPDLAIHVDHEMAKRKANEAVNGEDLDVLTGSSIKQSDKDEDSPIKKLLAEKWGLSDKVLASADLALVPAGAAREIGFDRTLIGSYALDDHICVAASWFAFLDLDGIPERTAVHIVMDKEEIGSDGISGADGALFETFVLELLRLEKSPCDALTLRHAIANTVAISADVTAGNNPLYESHYVRDQQPLLGNGPVIVKATGAGGKYSASEARGEMMATVINLLDEEDIPWQVGSFGKIDKAGGGTLGKYIARLGADVIDVGPGLISMHSPFEIGSKADFVALEKCYKAFFSKMKSV